MKYAITLASFRRVESIEETLPKLNSHGFDAVEMFGEPDDVDIKQLKDLFSTHHFQVCGITGMWGTASEEGWKRRLLSSDPSLVDSSVKYVQDCVRMCNSLNGEEMNVCLFADEIPGFDKTHHVFAKDKKKQLASRAVFILNKLCRFAADYGVRLVLEPLNRYSTPHCSTAYDAVAIVKEVNSDSLGVLLDTFHMNVEEDSFEEAIRNTGRFLKHTHFADNNRKMPGFAHIDFGTIMRSLQEIRYDGYISFEPNIGDRNYGYAVGRGLAYTRSLSYDKLAAAT